LAGGSDQGPVGAGSFAGASVASLQGPAGGVVPMPVLYYR
jgi:hypothetical protein